MSPTELFKVFILSMIERVSVKCDKPSFLDNSPPLLRFFPRRLIKQFIL